MNSKDTLLKQLLLSPAYLFAMLLGAVLEEPELGNWGARGLGLQGGPTNSHPSASGSAGLVGSVAEVRTAFEMADGSTLRGKVFVRGELWSAQMRVGANSPAPGNRVRVVEVNGLTLLVEPLAAG